MGTELINIKDLHVNYVTDDALVKAVNGINLEVGYGETLGLVGETGAGKTTTARAIMGILPQRTGKIPQGEIIFKGEDLVGMSNEDMRNIRGAHISMIFQDPMTSLNPTINVGDQIKESLENHKDKDETSQDLDKKVDEILELVGIPARRKIEYPHQFSGGMKQRVVIAIALACRPELLIADEPTTALDVTIQAQVLAMMNDLKEKFNTSTILITHDLGVVAETCDNVAIMYAGKIVEKGKIEDIFDSTKKHHPYTIGLFGSIPNIHKKTARLTPIEGLMPDPADLPSGCSFHERCSNCMGICEVEEPSEYLEGDHYIACHLFGKE